MAFVFVIGMEAQQESYSKNDNSRTQREEIVYQAVEVPVPISNLNDGSGGYADCFYYGDPSGMFMNEEWQKGSAGLKDGEILEGRFRYNLYQQKMEAIVDADTFAFAKPCEINELNIGDSKFIYSIFFRSNMEVSNTWFEVLCEGNCSLLIRRFIKYRVTDGDEDHSDDQLYKLEQYYTMEDGEAPERLLISKKVILETFKDHKDEVSAFMKSERIKLKEQKDLKELFAFYNSLD